MTKQIELIDSFPLFGIEKFDARLYVGLLRIGSATIGSISKKLQMDRNKIYRSLNKLRNTGLISTTFSNPTIYRPISPEEAFQSIIQKKLDEIITMRKLTKKITSNLESNQNHVNVLESESDYTIVQGASNIYARIEKLLQTSTRSIFLVTTPEDILKMYHTSIPEKIKILRRKGIELKLVTQTNDKNLFPFIKRLNASEFRIGDLPSKGRIVIEKQNQMIISGYCRENPDFGDDDSILFTNSQAMIDNVYQLCEQVWENSKPVIL